MMLRFCLPRRLAMATVVLMLTQSLSAQSPPAAPVRNVTDTHFGRQVDDPYRYMENLKDPEVKDWIKAQADYATAELKKIPARDALFNRIKELDEGAPYRISDIVREPSGRIWYEKRLAEENVGKFYVRDQLDSAERLLIDPKQFDGPAGQHASLAFCVPSPDGKYVAFGHALAGSEQTTLRVLDVQSGKLLPDTIDRMEADYTEPDWLPDSSGFVYSRRRKLPPDAPPTEGYRLTRAYMHKLGADPDSDPLVFAKDLSPLVPMADTDFPSVIITPGSAYAVGKIKHGDDNKLTLWAAPLDSLGRTDTPWKLICDIDDQVHDFTMHGNSIDLMTAKGAPRFKVVRTSLAAPDFDSAATVVPQSSLVIEGIASAKDALYVTLLDGALNRIQRLPYAPGAKSEMIALPEETPSGSIAAIEREMGGIYISTNSWIKGGQILALDPGSSKLANTRLKPKGRFDDVEGLQAIEVEAKSHDGVMVPLSIICRKDIKLDGSNPTLLSGYGSYGFGHPAYFDPVDLAWLQRGGVLAVAHVRGGGERGIEWHLAGQKLNKPNTWKDFIACAEYLIDHKYTSPSKLAGEGGSAGGILIGRAITERPDLFAAALINVGAVDAIRFETTTNGVPNIPEFGTVANEDGFRGLLEMSAYHHVKDGTKYPAVLLCHGINDPRVDAWMSAKMCARLQAATASNKPILFRVDFDAGHGVGSTKTQRQQMQADQYAFLLWQMGEEGFGAK